MAAVLKIAERGGVHRVRLEALPSYDSLDGLLRELWPAAGQGCKMARYADEEGDLCLLTRATFPDFLETAKAPGGGAFAVLRLEVLLPAEAPPGDRGSPAACRASRSPSPAASWLQLDEEGSSDGSWVCAGDEVVEESIVGLRGPGRPQGSSPRSRSSGSSGERPSRSEASFEPLGLRLAELRADDWGSSSAGGASEQEVAAAAAGSEETERLLADDPSTEAPRLRDTSHQGGEEEAPPQPFFDLDSAAPPAQTVAPPIIDLLAAPVAPPSPMWAASDPSPLAAPAGPPASLRPMDAAHVAVPDLEAGLGAEAEPEGSDLDEEPPTDAACEGPRRCVPAMAAAKLLPPPPAAPGCRVVRRKELGRRGEKVVHMGHICDGCEACPLPGPRFTCKSCGDFDLCWTCYMRRAELPTPHDPSHRFQQVLWSEEVVPSCPGGCGFGVVSASAHRGHCCGRCARNPGSHTETCLLANAHDDELDP